MFQDMPNQYPMAELQKMIPEDLAKIIDYYAVVIRILRKRLHYEKLTRWEKARIAVAAFAIRNNLGQTINIFSPKTLIRWYNDLKAGRWFYNNTPKKGRPQTPPDTVALIVKLAAENNWGYRSIQGELKKLGHKVCANTVKRVLREHGYPTGGKPRGLDYATFVKTSIKKIWSCDFITEEILSPQGFIRYYSLFFIHIGSRNVYYAGATHSPDSRWVKQQARNFSMHLQEHPELPCKYLIHDRDELLKPMKHVLKADKIKIVLTPPKAPKANAYAERFMGEVREMFNNFIFWHEYQIKTVCKATADHHNRHRPHQGIDNCVPGGYDYPDSPAAPKDVRCEERLGGLIKHYYVGKKAA